MTPTRQINIGGSLFACPIPLVFEDRYFFVAAGSGEDLFTVFLLEDDNVIFEVCENRRCENPVSIVTRTAAGLVTVADRKTGDFVYKIRPGYRGSAVFGRIKGKETEMSISDRLIRAGGVMLDRSSIQADVGITVRKDGSVGIAGPLPPEARRLFVKT
jgi:hypothetical protein